MNKEKFKRKCQVLIEYEDKRFFVIKEFIQTLNVGLHKSGYEIIARRWWLNHGENDGELNDERINFNKGYKCIFSIQFQIKGSDPDDESCKGFQIIELATAYGLSFFSNSCFKKYNLNFLYKNIKCYFEIIMKNGYETALLKATKKVDK